MLARPKPKTFTEEQAKSIASASAKQTGRVSAPKSFDPNYPVFEIPVNQKVLIYIPNHTVVDENGVTKLRMDEFMTHPIRDGRSYGSVRCVNGIVDEANGLDGTCPYCDATSDSWELYNKQWAELAESRGMDPSSAEAKEALKEERKALLDDRTVQPPDKMYTFPIVVIACEDGTIKPKLSADGKIQGTPMFYTIKEHTYQEKWNKAFDALEDSGEEVDYNPAGRWAVLNYTYSAKEGTHNKRDSARSLAVTFVNKPDLAQIASYFDSITESWTPQVCWEVLVANAIYSVEELSESVEKVMKSTRDKIALYNLGTNPVAGAIPAPSANASAESALASFGATPAVSEPALAGADLGVAPPTLGEMPAPPAQAQA